MYYMVNAELLVLLFLTNLLRTGSVFFSSSSPANLYLLWVTRLPFLKDFCDFLQFCPVIEFSQAFFSFCRPTYAFSYF